MFLFIYTFFWVNLNIKIIDLSTLLKTIIIISFIHVKLFTCEKTLLQLSLHILNIAIISMVNLFNLFIYNDFFLLRKKIC